MSATSYSQSSHAASSNYEPFALAVTGSQVATTGNAKFRGAAIRKAKGLNCAARFNAGGESMRGIILGTVVAVLVGACGGGTTDWATNFAGTWDGILAESLGSLSSSFSAEILITLGGGNSLVLASSTSGPLCQNGSGPPATATSASEFSGGQLACPAIHNGEFSGTCQNATETWTYSGGSGRLSGTVLTVVLAGSDVCSDGSSLNFTQTFTGAK